MRLSRITLVAAASAVALAGAALAGVVAHTGAAQTTVRVTEKEFSIRLSARTLPRGPVKFVVRNAGKYPHSLAIKGPGVSKRTPLIKPGKTALLVATLKSGAYNLWCPVPGHAAKGMRTTLTVPAPAGGTTDGTTSTGNDTTTDAGVPWG